MDSNLINFVNNNRETLNVFTAKLIEMRCFVGIHVDKDIVLNIPVSDHKFHLWLNIKLNKTHQSLVLLINC